MFILCDSRYKRFKTESFGRGTHTEDKRSPKKLLPVKLRLRLVQQVVLVVRQLLPCRTSECFSTVVHSSTPSCRKDSTNVMLTSAVCSGLAFTLPSIAAKVINTCMEYVVVPAVPCTKIVVVISVTGKIDKSLSYINIRTSRMCLIRPGD